MSYVSSWTPTLRQPSPGILSILQCWRLGNRADLQNKSNKKMAARIAERERLWWLYEISEERSEPEQQAPKEGPCDTAGPIPSPMSVGPPDEPSPTPFAELQMAKPRQEAAANGAVASKRCSRTS